MKSETLETVRVEDILMEEDQPQQAETSSSKPLPPSYHTMWNDARQHEQDSPVSQNKYRRRKWDSREHHRQQRWLRKPRMPVVPWESLQSWLERYLEHRKNGNTNKIRNSLALSHCHSPNYAEYITIVRRRRQTNDDIENQEQRTIKQPQ